MVEGLNAVEAWLGSLPGQVYANVRQPPISTLNLAHLIPLSAVWEGAERDEHFGQPPLLHARTEGSTPFRLSLHAGDVGHTLVVGPKIGRAHVRSHVTHAQHVGRLLLEKTNLYTNTKN